MNYYQLHNSVMDAHISGCKSLDGSVNNAWVLIDKELDKDIIDRYEEYLYSYQALNNMDCKNNTSNFYEYPIGSKQI